MLRKVKIITANSQKSSSIVLFGVIIDNTNRFAVFDIEMCNNYSSFSKQSFIILECEHKQFGGFQYEHLFGRPKCHYNRNSKKFHTKVLKDTHRIEQNITIANIPKDVAIT